MRLAPFQPDGPEGLSLADADARALELLAHLLVFALGGHARFLVQLVGPKAHEVAVPRLLELQLGEPQLLPQLHRPLHVGLLGQRQRRQVGLAGGVDQKRRVGAVVAARRVAHHHADGSGAEGAVGDDGDVPVRLAAVGNGPGHGHGVVDVDVLVHRHDELAHPVAVLQHGVHDPPGLAVVLLVHAHGDVGPHVDQLLHHVHLLHRREALAGEVAVHQGAHAHGLDLGALAGRHLADDGDPDGVLAVRHAGELHHRADGPGVDVAHGLAEGPFLFQVVGGNDALEHHLGGGGHLQVDGLALHQLDRGPGQSARQGQLVHVGRHLLGGGVGGRGHRAHGDGHLQRNAPLPAPLPVGRQVLGRARVGAAPERRFHQPAVVADVARARLRVLGDPVARGDVGAVVESRGRDGNGEAGEAAAGGEVVTLVNYFLDRAGGHHYRRDRVLHGLDPAVRHFFRPALEPQAVDGGGAGETAHQHRALVAAAL